ATALARRTARQGTADAWEPPHGAWLRPMRAVKRGLGDVSFFSPMLVTFCCALLQIAVPPPRGYVNDFAGVLDAASVAHMTDVITELREKTRGEVAVVTLADIDDRPAADVALQIGRQWGVGAKAAAGDPAKNLGVVVGAWSLLVVGWGGGFLLGRFGLGGWRAGGWGGGGGGGGWGGWGGGGGGGFGGGFGGFGGGGGFSGGGAGGRF